MCPFRQYESAAIELKLRKSQKTHIILGAMLSDTLSGAREGALGNTIPRDNNTYHDNPRHVWMPLNQINPLTYR